MKESQVSKIIWQKAASPSWTSRHGECIRPPHALGRHICPQRQGNNAHCAMHLCLGTLQRVGTSPPKVPLPVGDLDPIQCMVPSLCPHESPFLPKRHLDQLSRFCTAYLCIRHAQTHWLRVLRTTSVAIGRIAWYTACGRCGPKMHRVQ